MGNLKKKGAFRTRLPWRKKDGFHGCCSDFVSLPCLVGNPVCLSQYQAGWKRSKRTKRAKGVNGLSPLSSVNQSSKPASKLTLRVKGELVVGAWEEDPSSIIVRWRKSTSDSVKEYWLGDSQGFSPSCVGSVSTRVVFPLDGRERVCLFFVNKPLWGFRAASVVLPLPG